MGKKRFWVVRYFVYTFIFSWILWLPAVLCSQKIIDFKFNYMLAVGIGSVGPLFVSSLLIYKENGKKGLLNFYKRTFSFKFNKLWLLPAFFLLPLFVCAAFGLYFLTNNEIMPEMLLLSNPVLIIPSFVATLLIFGSLEEEFGWRGYATEKMEKKLNALNTSILLGVIWAMWHLPLFYIEGTSQNKMSFTLFFIGTVAITVIYTWLYNNTGGSMIIPLIFHTMHNMAFNLFPIPLLKKPDTAFLYLTIIQVCFAVLIVFIYGYKDLQRHT